MPVYLCQPGAGTSEPWRHGIPVYGVPFPLLEDGEEGDSSHDTSRRQSHAEAVGRRLRTHRQNVMPQQQQQQQQQPWNDDNDNDDNDNHHAIGDETRPPRELPPSTSARYNVQQQQQQQQQPVQSRRGVNTTMMMMMGSGGFPIRRVRHSEVVLADDICIAYDRYWLRLIWPGHKGGFAGYIAMGKVGRVGSSNSMLTKEVVQQNQDVTTTTMTTAAAEGATTMIEFDRDHPMTFLSSTEYISGGGGGSGSGGYLRLGNDHPSVLDDAKEQQEEEPQDTASMPPSEPLEELLSSSSTLLCLRTGLAFSSSSAMKLLAVYDDGIDPPVLSAPLPSSEPVFCRICREGLHDVADDQQPTASVEDGQEADTPMEGPSRHSSMMEDDDDRHHQVEGGDDNDDDDNNEHTNNHDDNDHHHYNDADTMDEINIRPSEPFLDHHALALAKQGPVQPHPKYQANPHAAENPLLAPCECSGSMAFVHYLCVEQWRCRSRHPDARHGLQCETCGSPYALPPPSARPASVQQADNNDDWLEAMPPHVMAALRRPHIWWQIGAAIVRRRWLRPIAPILMSPLVALYCRARRLLKKRGVARRRWACSLCRRRARWKCVRCLRSYYCSRQCQNVSWHIVHKHVCYKPARFWGSVIVYGVLTLLAFPGIIRDPLMYDLGLSLLPMSFLVMGILGGGLATLLKKCAGTDIRGRSLELAVVLLTVWLVLISWGLVGAFFGDVKKCYGFLGSYRVSIDASQPLLLRVIRALALKPGRTWFLMWDRAALRSGPWISKALCSVRNLDNSGCFEHLPFATVDFYLEENGGEKCASDLALVSSLWIAAGFALVGSYAWKRRERQRRAARRRHEVRPHQD